MSEWACDRIEDLEEKITKARTWAQNRLDACDRTQRESSSRQSRDWAYGESVAIKAMLAILDGKIDP